VVVPIPVNYRFIVHTHSHIALLRLGNIALTTLLYHLFLNKDEAAKGNIEGFFWFTQICLLGMLLSFPQGYALVSIVFRPFFISVPIGFRFFFIKKCSPIP